MTDGRSLGGFARRATRAFLAAAAGAVLALSSPDGSSKSSEIVLPRYLPSFPHQAYGYELARDGFRAPSARAWMREAERALVAPDAVPLPFETSGRFSADQPAAVGVAFAVRGARRLHIEIETQSDADAPAGRPSFDAPFVDLFAVAGGRRERIESAPPLRARPSVHAYEMDLAVLDAAEHVLRIQPEIGYSGRYRIAVRTAPLLAFPVEGVTTRAILSGFGAERDGGARSHRGVDIFAARGTPALAAMDAFVTRVETTPRGGNVVWLQALFGDLRLYYAHLDEQQVRPGDFVLAGDVVGTVGNTGNAITTPPHLHFGVYVRRRGMRGGAQDPYPFLD